MAVHHALDVRGLDEPAVPAARRRRLEIDRVLAHLGREVREAEVPVEVRLALDRERGGRPSPG